MKMRTLIVDDVALARQRVRMLLSGSELIDVVGECSNGAEAVESIHALQPNLVFLDVQMPGMTGFDVVEAVGAHRMPAVIFVTAFDQFAVRAFEVNAVDYLLKPFDRDRLEKAIIRARNQIESTEPTGIEERLRKAIAEVRGKGKYLKRIAVKFSRGVTFVGADDVDCFVAAGHYVELRIGKTKYMIRDRITSLEQKLDPGKFARIHRSTIVNIDKVRSMEPLFNGDQIVTLKNGTKVKMSRTYAENLNSRISS